MVQPKKEMENLNVRVPSTLKELVQKYVSIDCHTNISDFTRDALRQKLQKDMPHIYKQLFEKEAKKE